MLRHSRFFVPAFYIAIGALAFTYRADITAWAEHMATDAHVGTWVSFAALLAFAVVVPPAPEQASV